LEDRILASKRGHHVPADFGPPRVAIKKISNQPW